VELGVLLANRAQLSTVTSLTKMLSTASTLPIFTPALGHTYMPPVPKSTSTAAGSLQNTQTSMESTPLPDTQSTFTSSKPPLASGKTSKQDVRGAALLSGSLTLASKYHGEYMDENPLVGEPGSFILQKQKTRDAPSQSQQSLSLSQATSTTGKSSAAGAGESVKLSAPPTPAPLKTEGLPPVERKAKGEKTPVTPGAARERKRKKSKAAIPPAGGPAVGTPR